jgi:hypothetical protein
LVPVQLVPVLQVAVAPDHVSAPPASAECGNMLAMPATALEITAARRLAAGRKKDRILNCIFSLLVTESYPTNLGPANCASSSPVRGLTANDEGRVNIKAIGLYKTRLTITNGV